MLILSTMSRPPIELTESLTESICKAVRVGASLKHAAYYAGISYKTLRRWIKKGKAADSGSFWQLHQSIQTARSVLVISLLNNINKAADNNWKAAAWKLEHLFPEQYGKSTPKKSDTPKSEKLLSS